MSTTFEIDRWPAASSRATSHGGDARPIVPAQRIAEAKDQQLDAVAHERPRASASCRASLDGIHLFPEMIESISPFCSTAEVRMAL